MVSEKPARELPATQDQIADVFADLYDWFSVHWFADADNQDWAGQFQNSPGREERDRLATLIRESGWDTPAAIRDLIDQARHQNAHSQAQAVYLVLHAIDQAVPAFLPTPSRDLRDAKIKRSLADQYLTYGCLNTWNSTGFVLPKRVKGFRGPTLLRNHFKNLVRADVNRDTIRLLSNQTGALRERHPSHEVAIVPFLYCLEDGNFVGETYGDHCCFSVRHNGSPDRQLSERIQRAVSELRASKATIGLFPELTLNDQLLKVLQSALRKSAREDSNLAWVIAGTSRTVTNPEDIYPAHNVAFVFDTFGELVGTSVGGATADQGWVQYKRHRYMLSVGEQKRYALDTCFPPPLTDRMEAICIGNYVCIFEDQQSRYAILICEDWSQFEGTCEIISQMNCTTVFVLVMDGPVTPHRWALTQAGIVGEKTGVTAVIANSLLLSRQFQLNPTRTWDEWQHAWKAEWAKLPEPQTIPDGHLPVGVVITPTQETGEYGVMIPLSAPGDPMPPATLISTVVPLQLRPKRLRFAPS